MLEELPNLGHADPKVSRNAALKLIQHVSENKGELDYLVKRLVTGMESVKVATRAGCYSTLTTLLSLRKVDPFELFDMMEKCLITNKESTKKERRLIYIARILCIGAIFRTGEAIELAKDPGFLQAALKELVDLSQKKATYFLLATPFLSHLLQDNTLTQGAFDKQVWPNISPLFGLEKKKKKRSKDDDDGSSEEDDDEEESQVVVKVEGGTGPSLTKFGCQVQLALDCKNGEYKMDLECLKDAGKIAKALLTSNLQFEEHFLQSLFKHLTTSADPDQTQSFWDSLLSNIKSTQFDLLCLAVKTALQQNMSSSAILSRKLVRLLLSVFKLEDKEFHKKSRRTIELLLQWGKYKKGSDSEDNSSSLSKKERKSMIKILFDVEDPPNLLHEYKFLSVVIRPFVRSLTCKELEHLDNILESNLFENKEGSTKLGPRMAIVYIQNLGRIAQCPEASAELRFKIGERLLNIGFGREEIPIKNKEKEVEAQAEGGKEAPEDKDSLKGVHEQMKRSALDALQQILAASYNAEFITILSNHLIDNGSELTSNSETLKIFKDIRKTVKKSKGKCPLLEYVLRAYGIRVLLDEGQPLNTAKETVQTLMELVKGYKEEEGEELPELFKFITGTGLREMNPPLHIEGMFNKLLMEGRVTEEVVQVFAEAIDVELDEEGMEDEEDDDESESEEENKMEVDKEEEEEDSDDEEKEGGDLPPKKKTKLDPAQIAKLEEELGGGGSDSEESIALDEATEEELQKMDGDLAKVFALKKAMKGEEKSGEMAMMRTLRLVDFYIRRNTKEMPVSSLLILLMPVVHSLQRSLKLKKTQLPTRLIGTLDNLNRVKRFTGSENAVEGTLGTMAEELQEMGLQKKNKLIKELLEHSVILLTKCFLQKEGKRSKKEQKKFIAIYSKAVDMAKSKIKGRRQIKAKRRKGKKGKGGGGVGAGDNINMNTSRFVRLALESFPEWEEGRKAIQQKIQSSDHDDAEKNESK